MEIINNKVLDNENSTKINNQKFKRDTTFDIAKGIGILCVVLGHCNIVTNKFIYLFHMALFFIISGIFIKDKYAENVASVLGFIKKRIVLLAGTFILCNGIFLLLHNFFLDINFYSNNQLLLNLPEGARWGLQEYFSKKQIVIKMLWTFILARNEQLGGATWFLKVLLISSCIFVILKFLNNYFRISDKIYYGIIIILSLGLSYYFQKIDFNFYNIGSFCLGLVFLCVGYLIKKYSLLFANKYIFISTLAILMFLKYQDLRIHIGANEYRNIFYFMISSIAGFYFIYSLSKYLEKNNYTTKMFSYLGQHTLVILCLHFLAFKFVNLIELYVYNYPSCYMAAFPVIRAHQNEWVILFVLFGLYVPCLFSFVCFYIKDYFKLYLKNFVDLLHINAK